MEQEKNISFKLKNIEFIESSLTAINFPIGIDTIFNFNININICSKIHTIHMYIYIIYSI